jgi:glutamyl-tRNA reductase
MERRSQESWEDYTRRVAQLELGRALIQLSNGKHIEDIMRLMSHRIVSKLNSEIFHAFNSIPSDYDSVKSLEHYNATYRDKFGANADPIKD